MKQYNRIMLGKGGCFSADCLKGNYIGCDFLPSQDLTDHLKDNVKDFNKEFVPVFLDCHPEKTKVSAGLSCGFLWTICKGLKIGDTVLCPNGNGAYMVGSITSEYYYKNGETLPHRRDVKWLDIVIARGAMSQKLKNSSNSIGTCCDITSYAEEIEALITNAKKFDSPQPATVSTVKKQYLERDLHKILCDYLANYPRPVYAKTIYHEKSSNNKDSNQKWVHPDIVGVRFADFKKEGTSSLQREMDPDKRAQIFSFEMKRTIDNDYDLKQYYFQAVSNSSWANYGYLVAYEIDESLDEEIERLNSAFGIGVILLNAKAEDTKVLFQAKERQLDYSTIDKLCNLNPDFNSFISALNTVLKATNDFVEVSMASLKSKCDEIFKDDEELEAYCKEKGIPF